MWGRGGGLKKAFVILSFMLKIPFGVVERRFVQSIFQLKVGFPMKPWLSLFAIGNQELFLSRWEEAHYRFMDSNHCTIANATATNAMGPARKVNCPAKYNSFILPCPCSKNTNLSWNRRKWVPTETFHLCVFNRACATSCGLANYLLLLLF